MVNFLVLAEWCLSISRVKDCLISLLYSYYIKVICYDVTVILDFDHYKNIIKSLNKFEQVSSNGQKISLAGGRSSLGPMSEGLYIEVQYILGNGHMRPLSPMDRMIDEQTRMKT